MTAPARLHLGFVDLHGGLGRKFGSIGITIEEPRTTLTLRRAERLAVSGPSAERAHGIALRLIDALRLDDDRFEIAIEEAIPEHSGLGSGTQLVLALGAALCCCSGQPMEPRRIATLLRRGARSGIGIGAFATGGVIVDGGRGEQDQAPPPIVSRLDFPEEWRALLLFDPKNRGLSGSVEYEAFRLLPQFSERLAAELCRLILMQALPALAEADLQRFGEAVTELQRRVGDYFAPMQGGRFASPHVAAALAWLEATGIAGFGQSSWGPTGFAFAANPAEGQALMTEAERRWGDSLRFRLVKGRNRGAEIGPVKPPGDTASRASGR
ncbi:MAG: beta-ribofuranosylaminobenzene 5'-phosphate synthase family protein [Dongiaceae bacterium]